MTALRALDPEARKKIIMGLPPRKRAELFFDWTVWARTDQLWRPGPERYTVALSGRGWGKTRFGAEATRWVAYNAEFCGGQKRSGPSDSQWGLGGVIGIAGRTANDVNETILYGPSGLMTISPPWFKPHHEPSKKRLTWPNGVVARLFAGDVPESFRGPNIGFGWFDELAHWKKLRRSWEMVKLTLRLGRRTRGIITSTPIGVPTLLEIVFAHDKDGNKIPDPNGLHGFRIADNVRIIRGSTYDNAANLAEDFIVDTVGGLDGTTLGRQEIWGDILMGAPGAPWRQNWMRLASYDEVPDLDRIVVAVDPAMKKKPPKDSDKLPETGIVVAGIHYETGTLWVLEDLSGNYSGDEWARIACQAFHRHEADQIVYEENQGGDLVGLTIKHAMEEESIYVDFEGVRATKSKTKRANMVNTLWERGRAYHVGDSRDWRRMEFQMTHFDPRKGDDDQQSDRMDAVVWAALALFGDGSDRSDIRTMGDVTLWAQAAQQLQKQRRGGSRAQAGELISLAHWPKKRVDALAAVIRLAA